MTEASFNIAHSALLTLGLARSDFSLIGRGLDDRLHQPRRAALYPRSVELLHKARDLGAIGATVSGAGPGGAVLVPVAADRRGAGGAQARGGRLRRAPGDLRARRRRREGDVNAGRGGRRRGGARRARLRRAPAPAPRDWSLPKGKLDPGESFEEAALREVQEETGLVCSLGEELAQTEYHDQKGRPKIVRYWRMDVVEDPGFEPNDEVDELRWLTPADAVDLLSYEHDNSLLTDSVNASFRRGVREGMPFAVAGALLAISFGVLANDTGLGAWGAIVMSAVVFGGSAQFASVGIYSTGGGLGTALLAATLVNSRFLPMGVALAPYLPGGPLKRALQGQPLVDPSWVLARQTDGAFDRHVLFGASAAQYVTWVSGTAVGALVGTGEIDPDTLGRGRHLPGLLPDPAAGGAAPARACAGSPWPAP